MQKSYDSNTLCLGSDHRPVFSQFELHYDFTEGFATLQSHSDDLRQMQGAAKSQSRQAGVKKEVSFNESNDANGKGEANNSQQDSVPLSLRSQVKSYSKEQYRQAVETKVRICD